jgi:hypothetical protein
LPLTGRKPAGKFPQPKKSKHRNAAAPVFKPRKKFGKKGKRR